MKPIHFVSLLSTLFFLTNCSTTPERKVQLSQFYEETFEAYVKRNPQMATYLGRKTQYDLLNDNSIAAMEKNYEYYRNDLAKLRTIGPKDLQGQDLLSYQIFEFNAQHDLDGFDFRFHNYPVNQMFGLQSGLPSFMINMHRIDNLKDAGAYIQRAKHFEQVFVNLFQHLEKREKLGIIAPQFVWPQVRRDAQNIINGKPFKTGTGDSPLLKDFKSKLAKIEAPAESKKQLIDKLNEALVKFVGPAYDMLIGLTKRYESKANPEGGMWRLPNGEAYYQYLLKQYTHSNLSAQQIHQIGLDEVKRIQNEMLEIAKKVNFKGNLKQFLTFMKTDKQFYFSNDLNGRTAYLQQNAKYIRDMRKQLPKMFNLMPKAPVKVKAVEPYREKSAGRAFYSPPSEDGSRPGIYYINLYDLSRVPKFEMEALAYHEAIPGHHMQNALAQEIKGLPKFRKFSWNSAYGEGWALYSELIPKEFGFYQDPYSDFGRLSMELWRACRLVVDTGLHALKWSKKQAMDYLAANTPNAKSEITKAIERYLVMPGQATSYKIGMLKIQELRKKAEDQLKDKFSLPHFHDEVLRYGAVPLNILESIIDSWIQKQLKAQSEKKEEPKKLTNHSIHGPGTPVFNRSFLGPTFKHLDCCE
jgi:uncharacterized protein (DUF885 family)